MQVRLEYIYVCAAPFSNKGLELTADFTVEESFLSTSY